MVELRSFLKRWAISNVFNMLMGKDLAEGDFMQGEKTDCCSWKELLRRRKGWDPTCKRRGGIA